jgi:hypothetical protein
MRTAPAIAEPARFLVAGGITTDPLEKAPRVDDMQVMARRRLRRMVFDFVEGGVGAETTNRLDVFTHRCDGRAR